MKYDIDTLLGGDLSHHYLKQNPKLINSLPGYSGHFHAYRIDWRWKRNARHDEG